MPRSPLACHTPVLALLTFSFVFLQDGTSAAQARTASDSAQGQLNQLRLECIGAFDKNDYARAEKVCTSALAVANSLPEKDYSARVVVLHVLGATLAKEQKFYDSVPYFKQRYDLLTAHVRGQNELLGMAVLDLADSYQVIGKFAEAEPLYKQAISIFESRPTVIIGQTDLNRRKAWLQRALSSYVLLLRKTGRDSEADQIEPKIPKKSQQRKHS